MNNNDYVEARPPGGSGGQPLDPARLLDTLKRCDAAIARDPAAASAHYNRGFILHSLKRFEESLRSYDHAIRLKPRFAEAYYHRGNTLKTLRRLLQVDG